jgi:hypothetical protein
MTDSHFLLTTVEHIANLNMDRRTADVRLLFDNPSRGSKDQVPAVRSGRNQGRNWPLGR